MSQNEAEFEAQGCCAPSGGALPPPSGLWRGGRPPPDSLTALGRAHGVGTAESGWHRQPHTGTGDRYTFWSQAGRRKQARSFRARSKASSRSSRRAPASARRPTAAGGGPRAQPLMGRFLQGQKTKEDGRGAQVRCATEKDEGGQQHCRLRAGPLAPAEEWCGSHGRPFKSRWAAYPSGNWRRCQVNQRNHMSRQLAKRMRRVWAAELAHNLHAGGRDRCMASRGSMCCSRWLSPAWDRIAVRPRGQGEGLSNGAKSSTSSGVCSGCVSRRVLEWAVGATRFA